MQQVAEEIIDFQDRQEALALLGERDEYIRVLMDNFDARFISRGDGLSISGEASEVEPAAKIMRELQYLHRQGTTITMHEVRYSVGLMKGGKGGMPAGMPQMPEGMAGMEEALKNGQMPDLSALQGQMPDLGALLGGAGAPKRKGPQGLGAFQGLFNRRGR